MWVTHHAKLCHSNPAMQVVSRTVLLHALCHENYQNYPKCPMHTFAEGCGYPQSTVLSRQVDSTGADDGSLLSVHHQNNPDTQRQITHFILSSSWKNFSIIYFMITKTKLQTKYQNNCLHTHNHTSQVFFNSHAFETSRKQMT